MIGIKLSQRNFANPPWKRGRTKTPNTDTLKHWRQLAEAAALLKGGKHACGLCKRATMGQASVTILQPWPSRTKLTRRLCSEHYRMLTKMLAEFERTLDDYDLPIDKVGRGYSTGSGQRGTFTA